MVVAAAAVAAIIAGSRSSRSAPLVPGNQSLRPPSAPTHRGSVRYTPNGERSEVRHQMYLRFKQGAVYGIGFEEARKLCKISGKYKHNRRANQTALYLNCK